MNIDRPKTKMEAKQIHLFPLIIFFLLFTFSLQAISSPIPEQNNELEKRQKAFKGLEKVVGLPNHAASDHGEWTLRAVRFILDTMNWKYHFNGGEKPDVKDIEKARQNILTVIIWLVNSRRWNPYRPSARLMYTFFGLFHYLKDLEEGKTIGGKESPVYACYKAMWPTCIARAPATLLGEMVYRFECAFQFQQKCQAHHNFNGAHFDSRT